MQVTKYHSVGAYLINAILLINLLSPAFLPTYVMAQTITEEDEERIQQINKGQWDGALGVKNFTLPGLDNAPLTSTDPVTGEVVEHSYQQEDGSYNFSSIKMADMFQGFSQAQHEAYAADLEDIRDNPHQVQDSTYQMQLDKTTYADTECASLSSVDEQQRCELAKQALLLDDMRANEGADEFMGAGDSILTDFASIADGTNTYYSELQNEECVETLIEGEDGETSGLMNQHRCMVAAEDAEKVCEAERYVESTKVGEKVILSYSPPENDFDFINEFDSVSVRPCPNYEHDYTSCLEFDVLTISDVELVSSGSTDITDTYKRLSGYMELNKALYGRSKLFKHFAVASNLVAPSMILPSNLSTLMDNPALYISEFPQSTFRYEGGIQYHYEQIDECAPEDYYEGVCVVEEKFTDSLSGGSTSGQAFNNADVFRYQNFVDDLALTEPPIISGLEDIYTISPVEEPLLGPLLVPLGTFGLGFKPDPSQGEYDCSDGCWYAAKKFYIHAYFPETLKTHL